MNTRIAIGAGAIALLIGGVGPWVTALGGVISVNPTSSGEGASAVFGGAVVVLLAAALGRWLRFASIFVGVCVLIEAVYALVKIEQAKSAAGDWGGLISPGWGLFISLLAGVYLVASTWIVKRQPPEPEPTERELGSTPPPAPSEA